MSDFDKDKIVVGFLRCTIEAATTSSTVHKRKAALMGQGIT